MFLIMLCTFVYQVVAYLQIKFCVSSSKQISILRITRVVLYVIAAGGGAGVPLPQSPEEFDMPDNTVRTDGIFMLEQNDLEVHDVIVAYGEFGSIRHGTYQLRSKVIDVAVKVPKTVDADTEVSFAFFEGT